MFPDLSYLPDALLQADDVGPDPRQLAIIKQGVEAWNASRRGRSMVQINLRNADLRGLNLAGANLDGAWLSDADLSGVMLTDAFLSRADLSNAKLDGGTLCGATLTHAKLRRADLRNAALLGARLDGANLFEADLSGARLDYADMTGADLRGANLTDANIAGVRFRLGLMRGKCFRLRGVDSTYGNGIFKRALNDQDYLDALEFHWKDSWRRHLFRAWGLIDYGRSIGRVLGIAVLLMILFGVVYACWPELIGLECVADAKNCARRDGFTPFYFSIVVFTTLGFGDVAPKSMLGELVVSAQVLLGYTTLGLLLSVLADKLARRS